MFNSKFTVEISKLKKKESGKIGGSVYISDSVDLNKPLQKTSFKRSNSVTRRDSNIKSQINIDEVNILDGNQEEFSNDEGIIA